jgi:hypothetical protein
MEENKSYYKNLSPEQLYKDLTSENKFYYPQIYKFHYSFEYEQYENDE